MAVAVDIRPVEAEHLVEMAARLRPMDQLEYDAMMGGTPVVEGVRSIVGKSRQAWAAFADGHLVCIYGLLSQTLLSTEASPWLLATDEIDKRAVRWAFARRSKAEAVHLLSGYRRHYNLVHTGNVETIRWLKWLGFTFGSEIYPINGVEFVMFEKEG